MNDNILYFDCEATTFQTGHPFSKPNRLMCVGTLFNGALEYHDIEHSGLPYAASLARLRQLFGEATLVVGFNLKYDLHWLRLYCPDLVVPAVWDCQLAEFVLSAQRQIMPSLDEVLHRYDLPPKLDRVRTEYWECGLDTDQVPAGILKDYVLGDIVSLPTIHELQRARLIAANQLALVELQNEDLLTLQEMEFNGLLFDIQKAREKEKEVADQISAVILQLNSLVGSSAINWNSGHHCSAALYGGGINVPGRETVLKTLKSGKVKSYERNCIKQIAFPRLVAPNPRSEYSDTRKKTDAEIDQENAQRKLLRKPLLFRTWSTGESDLRMLRPKSNKAKEIIKLLLQLAKLQKLHEYLEGLPGLFETYQWRDDLIHGQLNQCVAVTGRIASAKPNLQNFADQTKELFYSRYPS